MAEALDGRKSAIYTPFWGRRDPQRAVMLQQYMILHSQQSNVLRRLSESNSTPSTSPYQSRRMSTSSMESSEANSIESSPALQATPSSLTAVPAYNLSRTTSSSSSRSSSISPIAEDNPVEFPNEMPPAEHDELFNINHEIKSTLTDLLNCESVRSDSKMRLWVQTRLMNAELELKRQRRRRATMPAIVVSPGDEFGERRVSL